MYKPKRDECGLNEHQRRRGRTFPFVVSLPTDRPVMRLRESNGQRTFSLDAIERPGIFLRPGASVISGPSENKVKLYFYFSGKINELLLLAAARSSGILICIGDVSFLTFKKPSRGD